MDNNTQLSSKKYPTWGSLQNAPMDIIVRVGGAEKEPNIRIQIAKWVFAHKYENLRMAGNLTKRIRLLNNKICYYYIMETAFNNIDFIKDRQNTYMILNDSCMNYINNLHSISSFLAGSFIDYLIRRIICEQRGIAFIDDRANRQSMQELGFTYNIFDDNMDYISDDEESEITIYERLPLSLNESYKIAKQIDEYETEDILPEIFITSLSQTLAFADDIDIIKVKEMYNIIAQNTRENNKLIIQNLQELCLQLTDGKKEILLNPAVGGNMPLINNKSIPSDCDIVIDDTLYDIKCTIRSNPVYEILQLLGYSSIFKCNPKYDKKINKIGIINLLQGKLTEYDISDITTENMIKYLNILTN